MSLLRGTHSWSETTAGTSSGGTAIHQDTNTSFSHIVSSMAVSGDKACVVTLESPAGTVLWRSRFTAAFDRYYTFPPKVIHTATGGTMVAKISDSTSNCEVNIQGYSII